MKLFRRLILSLALLAGNETLHAQSLSTPHNIIASAPSFSDDVRAIKWETTAFFAASTLLGFAKWDWGSHSTFTSHGEGWFNAQTDYGGADKLGHAFTTYAITNVLAERLIMQGRSPEQAARTAAILSSSLQLYIEVMDGFSKKYGFSYEDMSMNLLGAAFAYTRHAVPGMRDVIDFRMEYEPSGDKSFDPVGDYSGQKYLLALKFSGISTLHKTPLRYLEMQAGYYTNGFSNTERARGDERVRYTFIGVGINLSEIFFGRRQAADSGWQRLGRGFFEHIQIPRTAMRARHND